MIHLMVILLYFFSLVMLCYEKYFEVSSIYIPFNPYLNAYSEHLHFNANRTFEWNATPSLVSNIKRFFTLFLIKTCDQLPLHSQLFLNYIN